MRISFFHKSIASLLLISFLGAPLILAIPQQAGATGIPVIEDGPLLLITTKMAASTAVIAVNTTGIEVTSAASAANLTMWNSAWWTKERILDIIFTALAKAAIRQLTMQIINWINNDFNGNPMYNTSTGGTLQGIIDQAVGNIVYDTDFAFICSPFRLEILAALQLRFASYRPKIQCTLTQIQGNVQNFYQGAFRDLQSWDTWFQVTTVPTNNVYGAYIAAEGQLRAGIVGKQSILLDTLRKGMDFYPKSKCTVIKTNSRDQYDSGTINCQNETPGVLVANQLSWVISSPIRQLELVNEVDQAVSAIGSALALKAITTGLRALSQATSPSQPSFIDAYGAYVDQQTLQHVQDNTTKSAGEQLANEEAYYNAKYQTLRFVASAGDALLAVKACYQGKATSTTLSGDSATVANNRIKTASTTLDKQIIPLLTSLIRDVAQASSTIRQARQQIAGISQSTSTATAADAYTAVQNAATSISLNDAHAITDRLRAETDRERIKTDMDGIQKDADSQLSECRALNSTTRSSPGGSSSAGN